MLKFLSFLILISPILTLLTQAEPQHVQWTREISLERGVVIRWNNDAPDYLLMEISAPVRGYVALGFSTNGAMRGSDIVLGWVDSTGTGHLKDLHGVDNTLPLEDDQSDYDLLWATETDNGLTTLRFKRRWDTCDTQHDLKITDDTVRLIWAISETDPIIKASGAFLAAYHGPNFRGGKSLYLKEVPKSPPFPVNSPDIFTWDVHMEDIPITGKSDTTYHCKIFKAPEISGHSLLETKHQIIGYKPIIQEENKQWVHHINFFECTVPQHLGSSKDIFEQFLNHPGEECYTRNMPPEWGQFCITFPITWAVGAEGLMFPEHGGIPLMEIFNGTQYFMLEIHYNNIQRIQFKDSSGLSIFVTHKTRENDYGQISIHSRFGQFQMIPPHSSGFKSMAFCTPECTAAALPPEGITVTHAMLHAHLTARKLVIRHIRDGVELAPIAQDMNYDFDYQQMREVHPPRRILPGDIVLTECEYNTLGRTNITYGGTSTTDEMCQGYITYYPKIPLAICKTQHEFYSFFDALGIQRVEGDDALKLLQLPYRPNPEQFYDPPDDAYSFKNGTRGEPEYPFDVLSVKEATAKQTGLPITVRKFVNQLDWKGNSGQLGQKVWAKWWSGLYNAFCTGPSFTRIPLNEYLVTYPKFVPYKPPASSSCRPEESVTSSGKAFAGIGPIITGAIMLAYIFPYFLSP